jgi:S-adenosylmethionine synthetase
VGLADGSIGAGDQGIMYGFACDESDTFMPLTHYYATKLCRQLSDVRKNGQLPWLYPDGKSQVTMEYGPDGEAGRITGIVVSAHHAEGIQTDYIRESILHEVIYPVIDSGRLCHDTKIHINPTGGFSIGGPMADTGLTGRKIMVDTYGGVAKHGGGAFSGKDPSKVDRSAAYMARYVAKNVVAAKLARRCEVALAYAIGRPAPEAVTVRTFGTERIPTDVLRELVDEAFSYSVGDILSRLGLRKPCYRATAAYGHFGRDDPDFRWEALDMADRLCEEAMQRMKKRLFG